MKTYCKKCLRTSEVVDMSHCPFCLLFEYETKKETKEFDPEIANGRLMAWVCYEIMKEEKQRILATAKDHYWDSVSKDKDIIIKHLEDIIIKHLESILGIDD